MDSTMKMGLLIIAVVALLYMVSNYSNKQTEGFTNLLDEHEHFDDQDLSEESPDNNEPSEEVDALTENFTHESGNQHPKDCFPKDQLTPGELLPGDPNSKWSESVPSGQGELGDQNFLTAGYHVGVNTVGQTLRNANRQIRSEPPNPQVKVSPWLQTTIETDTNRRPLEIGGCK
jgi:hypothetical protein